MSYENLEKARAKRTDKEIVKEVKDKSKRSQKRKNATLKTDTSESNAKMMRINKTSALTRVSVVQMSETSIAQDKIVSKS